MTTAETWAKRVEEWQASGQTSTAFCEGREFTAGGLRHWAHRLRVQAAKASGIPTDQIKLARVVAVKAKASRPNRAVPAVTESSGTRRPTLSLSGPTMSWPSANPTIVPVRVSWMAAAVVSKSASSTGKAGRYRSIVNGPSAVSAPSRTM